MFILIMLSFGFVRAYSVLLKLFIIFILLMLKICQNIEYTKRNIFVTKRFDFTRAKATNKYVKVHLMQIPIEFCFYWARHA